MTRALAFILLMALSFSTGALAADTPVASGDVSSGAGGNSTTTARTQSIDGTWITQAGAMVKISTTSSGIQLEFPEYARRMEATFDGSVLVYITHYRTPNAEECYIDVPQSEFKACQKLIQIGEPRHRFILNLSANGMVLSGTKETYMMQCEWDTNSNGVTSNHRVTGHYWKYYSDYQWVKIDCNFDNLPSLSGNALQRYDLINTIITDYGFPEEFSLKNFVTQDRVKFVYQPSYLDVDTGVFVPLKEASNHQHIEPLNGKVSLDPASGQYIVELFPYSFESYVNLLSGLTILLHQLHALETAATDNPLSEATIQMQLDSLNYVWSHRNRLCAHDDERFGRHVDFLQRALALYEMSEPKEDTRGYN